MQSINDIRKGAKVNIKKFQYSNNLQRGFKHSLIYGFGSGYKNGVLLRKKIKMENIQKYFLEIQEAISKIKENELKIREMTTSYITDNGRHVLGNLAAAKKKLAEVTENPEDLLFLQKRITADLGFKKPAQGYHSPGFWEEELKENPGKWKLPKRARVSIENSEVEEDMARAGVKVRSADPVAEATGTTTKGKKI